MAGAGAISLPILGELSPAATAAPHPCTAQECPVCAQCCLSVQCLIHGSQLCSQIKSLCWSSRREGEGRRQQPQGLYSSHDPVQTLALWHLTHLVCVPTVGTLCHSNDCHSAILALRPRQRWAAYLAVNHLLPSHSPLPILLGLGSWHLPSLPQWESRHSQAQNSLKNLLGHCYIMLLSNR